MKAILLKVVDCLSEMADNKDVWLKSIVLDGKYVVINVLAVAFTKVLRAVRHAAEVPGQ